MTLCKREKNLELDHISLQLIHIKIQKKLQLITADFTGLKADKLGTKL